MKIKINSNPSKEKAAEICAMYEAALGEGGIYGTGCEQYPDPDLFSKEGIESIIDTPERQLIIAEAESSIVGGAILDWACMQKRHCEINCLATSKKLRGRGIGRSLFDGAKKIMDQLDCVVNTTEFVTHSMHSQAAFFEKGRTNFVAFSYCHYPYVFFADHPESVIWMVSIHGNKTREVLNQKRTVYLPSSYATIGNTILKQFSDLIDYEVLSKSNSKQASKEGTKLRLSVNPKGSYRYCHFNFSHPAIVEGIKTDQIFDDIDQAIEQMMMAKKEFILARIAINTPEAIEVAEYLKSKGFAFHGVLPLNELDTNKNYSDILTMQWINPKVLSENSWPGDTNSVIKIYGYPVNITKDILKVVQSELYRQ